MKTTFVLSCHRFISETQDATQQLLEAEELPKELGTSKFFQPLAVGGGIEELVFFGGLVRGFTF